MGTTPRASPEPQLRTQMSAVSFRSAVATGLVAKPAARDVKARAGLKVYARMTKDRVSLKKDSKWRSDIDIYPEWGESPMSERTSPLTSLTYDEYKNNVSAEIIHGRFAMLGVTGAWAQENLVGTPWFMAGEECTFDSCSISYLNNKFEASYDGALLGIIFLEIVLMGGARASAPGCSRTPSTTSPRAACSPAGGSTP